MEIRGKSVEHFGAIVLLTFIYSLVKVVRLRPHSNESKRNISYRLDVGIWLERYYSKCN